jgi:hypothetical protein
MYPFYYYFKSIGILVSLLPFHSTEVSGGTASACDRHMLHDPCGEFVDP